MNESKLGTRSWFAATALVLVMSGAWMLIGEREVEHAVGATSAPEPDPKATLTTAALSSVSRAQYALAEQNYGEARSELDAARRALQLLIGEREMNLAARHSD